MIFLFVGAIVKDMINSVRSTTTEGLISVVESGGLLQLKKVNVRRGRGVWTARRHYANTSHRPFSDYLSKLRQ